MHESIDEYSSVLNQGEYQVPVLRCIVVANPNDSIVKSVVRHQH